VETNIKFNLSANEKFIKYMEDCVKRLASEQLISFSSLLMDWSSGPAYEYWKKHGCMGVEPKMDFKIGDWIRYIGSWDKYNGKIHIIKNIVNDVACGSYINVSPLNRVGKEDSLVSAPSKDFIALSPSLITESQMSFKVGDKVKITQATIDTAKDIYKDFQDVVGEVIKYDKTYGYFKVKIGSHAGLWFESSDIEMVENSPLKSCICESWDLFNKGCTCGYIRKLN